MTTPFTYLIGWPELQKFYYGVRYRPNCDPKDLWTKYFTSSKEVHALRKAFGEPTLVQVRKTFSGPREAREWEHKVLRRLKAHKREDFLNLTCAKAPSMLGKKHSEESKLKSRLSNLGKKRSAETCKKNSQAQLLRRANGYSDSAETRLKKSMSHIGIQKSAETRALIATLKVGKHHWNNGSEGRYCVECPGEGWVRGKISHKRKREAEASL